MRAADLARFLDPLRRRVQNMVARAVIELVDDATRAQALQLSVLDGEAHAGVERFQEYGFSSVPRPGAEAILVFVGGLRSHGIAIAVEDRRYRLTGLADGEVAVHDDQGQALILKRDGIRLVSPMKVTIDAPAIALGAGGAAVARVGDPVAGGKIVAGSSVVTAG